MIISEQTAVGDIARTLPSSMRIFQQHGIDFCCGGRRSLGAACRDQGVAFADIVHALAASEEAPPDARDWTREPLHVLISHIIATYHEPLRAELPRLESMAAKVVQAHGGKDARLLRVETVIRELASDLLQHMMKEERVLFPALRVLERNGQSAAAIAAPIAAMEHEHDDAGRLLAELRTITDDYTSPPWACGTLRALYQGLSELESAMHVHVHLENNILFPRALAVPAAHAQG